MHTYNIPPVAGKSRTDTSTEALILAAQEQALGTRSIEAVVYHTRQDPRCRLQTGLSDSPTQWQDAKCSPDNVTQW